MAAPVGPMTPPVRYKCADHRLPGLKVRSKPLTGLAPRTRIERATCPLGGGCSIH